MLLVLLKPSGAHDNHTHAKSESRDRHATPQDMQTSPKDGSDAFVDADRNDKAQAHMSWQMVWQSNTSLADVRDWQPHTPGDPTNTPIFHSFGMHIAADALMREVAPACVGARISESGTRRPEKSTASACTLLLGLFLPDARMSNLTMTETTAAAFSVRFANDGVPWLSVRKL